MWKNVKIDPELRSHILLSGRDIHDLSVRAQEKPDPDAWLSEELNRLGRERRDRILEQNAERRTQDAAVINDHDRWPGPLLRLKTQPWMNETKRMRFASIHWANPLLVIEDGGSTTVYESVEKLVEIWSVD